MDEFLILLQVITLAVGFALFWSIFSAGLEKVLGFLPEFWKNVLLESLQYICVAISSLYLIQFYKSGSFHISFLTFIILVMLFFPNPRNPQIIRSPNLFRVRSIAFLMGLTSYIIPIVLDVSVKNPLSSILVKIVLWIYSLKFIGWIVGLVSLIIITVILLIFFWGLISLIAVLIFRKN